MSKAKIILIASAVLYALILGGLGFMMFKSHGSYKQAQSKIDPKKRELTKLKNHDPFPSQKNVAVTFDNIEAISNQLARLTSTISKEQVRWTRRKPDEFKDQLRNMRKELGARAIKGRITLPEEFWFGFNRYEEGAVPFPNDVPRLTEQLLIINSLMQSMFESGIEGVQVVLREEFEPDPENNNPPPEKLTLINAAGGKKLVNAKAGIIPEGEQYGTYTFRFTFDTKQAPLNDIINKIGQNTMFMRIVAVHLESEIPDMEKPEVLQPAAATVGAAPAAFFSQLNQSGGTNTATDASTGTVKEEKKDEIFRIAEYEKPATVTLDLEVFVFPDSSVKGGGE